MHVDFLETRRYLAVCALVISPFLFVCLCVSVCAEMGNFSVYFAQRWRNRARVGKSRQYLRSAERNLA